MRWTPGGSSDDIEDRRDEGGSGGMQFGGLHLGIGGIIIVFILSLVFHRNFFALLSGGPSATITQQDPAARSASNRELDEAEKPMVDFVTFVLNDTQGHPMPMFSSQATTRRD